MSAPAVGDEETLVEILVSLGVQNSSAQSQPSIILNKSSCASNSGNAIGTIATQRPFPLYNDILLHMVSFLQLSQMHTAAQLSKQWYHVLKSMKPLRSEPKMFFRRTNLARIPPDATSTIGRHFKGKIIDFLLPAKDADRQLILRLPALFPHLVEMGIEFESDPMPSNYQCSLPDSLHILNVCIGKGNWPSVAIPMIGALNQLRELDLTVSHEMIHIFNFSPLNSLQQLDSLKLTSMILSNSNPGSPSLLDFLRQTRLSRLEVNVFGYSNNLDAVWATKLLKQISDSPHCPLIQSGNLVAINTRAGLNRQLLEVLTKFPSLTELEYHFNLAVDGANLLQQLPNIQRFKPIRMWDAKHISMVNVAVACQNLPNIRELELCNWDLNKGQLDECLACLPKLTSLHISMCDGITTLAPLVKYGLPQRLQYLQLYGLDVPSTDLTSYVLPLVQLRKLSLKTFSRYNSLPETERRALKAQLLALPNLDNTNERNLLP